MAARTEEGPQRWEAAAAMPITSNTRHIPVIRTQLVRLALTFAPPYPKPSSEIVGLLFQIFFHSRAIDPGDGFGNPLRMRQSRASGPKTKRFVSIAEVADVLRLVLIEFRVRIGEAKLPPEQFEVVRISGQKCPAGANTARLGILLEHARGIFLRLQRNGVHKDVPANSVPQKLLHAYQIRRDSRADALAPRVSEIDGDNFTVD